MYSCEDATDIIQPGELGESAAFVNTNDLVIGNFGIYSLVNSNTSIAFTSRFTDEVSIGSSHGGQDIAIHQGILNENSGYAEALWANNYRVIFRANSLLAAAENIVPEEGEQEAYDEAIGTAIALRAYAYSQLLAYYGEDLLDDSSLGVILIDFPANASTSLPRSTVGETFEFIFDDLETAENLLISANTEFNEFLVSRSFIQALRARVANYRGDNSLASSNANAVLANFTLPTEGDEEELSEFYGDVPGAGGDEAIFTLEVTLNSGPALVSLFNTNASDLDGGPIFEMSRDVFNILQSNFESNGDVRRNVYVDPSSEISATPMDDVNPRDSDQIVIDKYPGNPILGGLAGGLRNNNKIIRTAEMHFILAEVAARTAGFTEAARQIDLVRNARYTTPVVTPAYTSASEAFTDILLERRLELFVEGHRYIDVRRLGALAGIGYDRNPVDCTLYQSPLCDRPATDTETQYLPIPLAEFTGNPAISGQQNPGY
ncbi:hypothetical protein BST86_00755 [Nonlabens agnitus]|uniref:RagB/SusD family nutrient uptake outer membrane protein n=2 Tax=Nonlabens agnitus TaxID=870484 RepID=A0A2S9WQG3_9FLAO|nr:hypothetical protein BST86_00755 [Nonlabens agnitus]